MLKRIREKVYEGKRLTYKEGIELFKTDDIFFLGEIAEHVSRKKNKDRAYFIQNLHINPTNICINRCRFCAFSRSRGEDGAYELTRKDIIRKIKNTLKSYPLTEVHIVGGLHPEWNLQYYLNLLSSIKSSFPSLSIKAFTATEVDHMQRRSRLPLREVVLLLKGHGLDMMPGGGAEVFDEVIRKRLCPEKLSGKRWLSVMETAHSIGIKSNATMLYGHLEGYEERVDHLLKLRELQDRTGGFQSFIPLPYQQKNSGIDSHSSAIDDLKTIAVSRLLLDNFPHIKAYWVMLTEKVAQLSLLFGADDLNGTVIDEKITYSISTDTKKGITKDELIDLIRSAGKVPIERDSFYRKVKHLL